MTGEGDGKDRRRHPRKKANIVVRYHILEEAHHYDVSQSQNIGEGGMLLTTNRRFLMGTRLALTLQVPGRDHKLGVTGQVVESREILKDLIYQTRLRFYDTKGRWIEDLAAYVGDR